MIKNRKNGQKITVSVIGGHEITRQTAENATEIGRIIAKNGAILVCGGLDGVMKAAAKGAKEAGGLTIGILPGKEKADANPYIDIALPTSIGYARNAIVACSADIIVALPGSQGTRSEISYGLVYKRPIIDFGNWDVEGMTKVRTIKEAEAKIKDWIEKIKTGKGEMSG